MATTLMPELPREFLAAARKGQAYALDAIRTWAQTVQSAIPELRTPQIPFADRLPKPETVLANAYDFAGQLLASQRHFAEELLKVTEPLMPAIDNGRNAPATRTAPQTPAAHTSHDPAAGASRAHHHDPAAGASRAHHHDPAAGARRARHRDRAAGPRRARHQDCAAGPRRARRQDRAGSPRRGHRRREDTEHPAEGFCHEHPSDRAEGCCQPSPD